MKKIVILVLVAIVTISTFSFGQRAKIRSGDKNYREIRKSSKIFHEQINDYQVKVYELQVRNKKMLAYFKFSTDTITLTRYSRQIGENDSLIAYYNQQIGYLEDRLNSLIVASVGDEDQNYIRLCGDAKGAAEAYLLISYADNIKSGNAGDTTLKGIVVNKWYYPVMAVVQGPGNFYREFSLKANNDFAVFSIPFLGQYTTTFITSNERKSVTKQVGPNIVYYDDARNTYAYMATLPRY